MRKKLISLCILVLVTSLLGCGLGVSKSGGKVLPDDGQGDGPDPCTTCGQSDELALTEVEPDAGAGGQTAILRGSGFEADTIQVYFGSNEAQILSRSGGEMSVIVPASEVLGSVAVRIVRNDGVSAEFPDQYTYNSTQNCGNGPKIYYSSPSSAPRGEPISVHGEGFVVGDNDATSSVFSVNGLTAVTVSRSSNLFVLFPPNLDRSCNAARCTFDISMINPDGCRYEAEGVFEYLRTQDEDEDGLNDFEEYECQSDPELADTDSDGLTDRQECQDYGSNPNVADSDGDDILDYDEVTSAYPSSPVNVDSDCDGIRDNEEVSDFDAVHVDVFLENVVATDLRHLSRWSAIDGLGNLGFRASLPDYDTTGFHGVVWCPAWEVMASHGLDSNGNCYYPVHGNSYFRYERSLPEIPMNARNFEVREVVVTEQFWDPTTIYINGAYLSEFGGKWTDAPYGPDLEREFSFDAEPGGSLVVGVYDHGLPGGPRGFRLAMDMTFRYRFSTDVCR